MFPRTSYLTLSQRWKILKVGDIKRWEILIVIASEAKQSHKKVEIATFPSVTRNDNLLYEIVQPVMSKAKESSSLLAMTLE